MVLSVICANLLLLHNLSYAQEYYDSAYVVETKPIVERLYAPSRTCNHPSYKRVRGDITRVQDEQADDPGALILGALLGGAAGSAVGKGKGKDAATAIGAIIGAKIATGGEFTGEELLGAIAGGVVGNQVGGGSGRTVATAAGAVAGSLIAKGLVSRDRSTYTRVCGDKIVSRRVITGYEVEFEYNGYLFTQELPYRPDDYVDIAVNVEVIEDITRDF